MVATLFKLFFFFIFILVFLNVIRFIIFLVKGVKTGRSYTNKNSTSKKTAKTIELDKDQYHVD